MNTALLGVDLIDAGLEDLREGRETIAALLVAIGAPRLRDIGLELPEDLPCQRVKAVDADLLHPCRNCCLVGHSFAS